MAANPPVPDNTSTATLGSRLTMVIGAIRWIVAGVLALILTGSFTLLAVLLLRPEIGDELTGGLIPPQYFADFHPEDVIYTDAQYRSVWTVAHNSGDQINTVVTGLLYGADIIEMDVVAVDGALYSAHKPPLPFLDYRWFRGPQLAMVWAASGDARGFMLDLKQDDQEFVDLVIDYINSKPETRPFFVASRNPRVLRQIDQRAPQAVLLMSIPDRKGLDDLLSNDSLLNVVDGVTIRHDQITEETASRMNDNDLMIFAWVVNDLTRVNRLLELGVDGITSDNLAILQLLGGQSEPDASTNPGGPPPDAPVATPSTSPSASSFSAALHRSSPARPPSWPDHGVQAACLGAAIRTRHLACPDDRSSDHA